MIVQFEGRHQPLISGTRVLLRMIMFTGIALALDAILVVFGALGFHEPSISTGWTPHQARH